MRENDTRDKIVEAARKIADVFDEKIKTPNRENGECPFSPCRECILDWRSTGLCGLIESLPKDIGLPKIENMTYKEATAAMMHCGEYATMGVTVYYFDGGAFRCSGNNNPVVFGQSAKKSTEWHIVPQAQELPLVDFDEARTALRAKRRVRQTTCFDGDFLVMKDNHVENQDGDWVEFSLQETEATNWQILPDEEENNDS